MRTFGNSRTFLAWSLIVFAYSHYAFCETCPEATSDESGIQTPPTTGNTLTSELRHLTISTAWSDSTDPLRLFFEKLVQRRFSDAFENNLDSIALTIDHANLMVAEGLDYTGLGVNIAERVSMYRRLLEMGEDQKILTPLFRANAFKYFFDDFSWPELHFQKPKAPLPTPGNVNIFSQPRPSMDRNNSAERVNANLLDSDANSVGSPGTEPQYATTQRITQFREILTDHLAGEVPTATTLQLDLDEFEKLTKLIRSEIMTFRSARESSSDSRRKKLIKKIKLITESSQFFVQLFQNSNNFAPDNSLTVRLGQAISDLVGTLTNTRVAGAISSTDGDLVDVELYQTFVSVQLLLRRTRPIILPGFGSGKANPTPG